MAYNRTFNPDSLPAFAEPERKNPPNNAPAPSARPNQVQSRPSPQGPNPPQPPPKPNNVERRPSPQRLPPNNNYGYGAPPPQNPGMSSSPPANHGRPQSLQTRPLAVSRPPPTPGPPAGSDPTLWPLFKAVDKTGNGHLTEKELGAALVNGDWSSFDPHTVKMMIRMFDTDRSGSINFDEFCGLWSFLASWRSLFDRFDADKSGNISLDEFTNALVAFGYRLSPQFVDMLFRTYDKKGDGAISFDLFVQSCISLKRMTDVFKKYDDDRDGFITLSFEDFLTEIIRQR